jgi:non-specific serine/threonine protein kinase
MVQGDYDVARALFKESAEIYRELGEAQGTGRALAYVGIATTLEQHESADEAMLDQAMRLLRHAGDSWGVALVGSNLAMTARRRGDLDTAAALIEEYVGLARTTGDRYLLGSSLAKWSNVVMSLREYDRATALYGEALRLFRELRDAWWTSRCIHYLGLVACARNDHRRAARLWGSAEAVLETTGARLVPWERDTHAQAEATARAEFGEEAFNQAWTEGRAMSLERAIEYALSPPEPGPVESGPAADRRSSPLTRRELEIAALIGRGLTSREIAEELVIAEKTADTHADRIRSKLGLRSRAEITAWAARQGLLDTGAPD